MNECIQQGDPTNFADEAKVIYWKKEISGSKQLVHLTKTKQEREKRKKVIEHFLN